MSLTKKRVAFKPFEYPEVTKYKDAINHSYWLVSEWNFISDIQDFNVKLNDQERNAVKNTLLAISQIEVSVKRFWTNLGKWFPKPEIEQVGVTFGESEVRHADAYSHLLEVLGLNEDFDLLLQNPIIQGRVQYLTKYLKQAADTDTEEYTLTLALFSIFIENVSLFSQFAIIKSFSKHKNMLKDIDNVVQATQQEELIHAQFGVYLLKQIKKEFPKWFDEDFYKKIYRAAKKAYLAEEKILDWIFEEGELNFISKDVLKEFIKDRINKSIVELDGEPVFEINQDLLKQLEWFNEEIYSQVNSDFFYKKPVTYSKKVQSIKEEDLF
jgi:ribonucleoside-diphosphate reductase beta chain